MASVPALPPGPRAPSACQAAQGIARPTPLLAGAAVGAWQPGRPITALVHMRELTLRVIMAAVFGAQDDALRAEIRRALEMTHRLPRLVAMAVVQADLGPHSPWGSFRRAVAR